MDFRETLRQLQGNLNILQEREAKFGSNVPLELINQIADHKTAIGLTEQALAGELDEAEWREALRPLLVVMQKRAGEAAINTSDLANSVVNINMVDQRGLTVKRDQYNANRDININQTPEEPPVWRGLGQVSLILTIIVGLCTMVGVGAAVLAVPGVSDFVYNLFSPLSFPRENNGETLIVIATFHETTANRSESHFQIKRAIEEVAEEAGLKTLRVEVEPTVLRADEREEAEALGQRYDASIIVWGEDTGVQVWVNFLNLKQPNFEAAYVPIEEKERTQVANPKAYADFILSDLPGQMTFLSFFAVGHSYYVGEQYVQAKDIIEQGIDALSPDSQPEGLADAYFRLGWLYHVRLTDSENAMTNYTQAIELDPDYATAYNNRGNVYSDQEDLEAAIADYNRAIELNPDYALAYNNRGIAYSDQEDLEAAIADYSRAIELNPDYALAYNNRGIAYSDQEDLEAAIADYNQAIELDPDYAWAYNNRGIAYRDQEDLEAAIADYNRAIELDPDYALAYNNRGIAYRHQEDLEAAIADYNRAIELDPDYASAYNNRGLVYVDQGDLPAAMADYNRAIELDPDYADAYNGRGIVYHGQGNLEAAAADFDRAVELNPDYAEALNNACFASSLLGRVRDVIELCERAVSLEPENGVYRDSRGVARALTGDLQGAIEDFEVVVAWLRTDERLYDIFGATRERWLAELKAGRNPIDEATLAELGNEPAANE
jgi:tetratricopeptide (TPR) repeat protein